MDREGNKMSTENETTPAIDEEAAAAVTDVQPELDFGGEAEPPLQEKMPEIVEISTMATFELYAEDGVTVEKTEQIHRGLFPVFKRLLAIQNDANANRRVFVYLTCKDKDDKERKLKIVDATISSALLSLTERMQPSSLVMERLQLTVSQVAEVSPLKGLIVTAVFGDAQAAGFGFLSESIDVTDEDIKVLGSSAENQVTMFKDKLRKDKRIEFPGDSVIITPGQAGIFIP